MPTRATAGPMRAGDKRPPSDESISPNTVTPNTTRPNGGTALLDAIAGRRSGLPCVERVAWHQDADRRVGGDLSGALFEATFRSQEFIVSPPAQSAGPERPVMDRNRDFGG